MRIGGAFTGDGMAVVIDRRDRRAGLAERDALFGESSFEQAERVRCRRPYSSGLRGGCSSTLSRSMANAAWCSRERVSLLNMRKTATTPGHAFMPEVK